MDLGSALDSINTTKVNLIRDGGSPVAAEKLYPGFPVARSLSYHADCILILNELNRHGLADHNVSNKQHYEFLLYSVDRKKRFAKWGKPEKVENIELIMEKYRYSYEKAADIVDFFSAEDLERLRLGNYTGGTETSVKKKGLPKKVK